MKLTPTPATPRSFDGWVMLFNIDGQSPSVYRVERLAAPAGHSCEECGLRGEDTVQPMYRTVPLHTNTPGEPDLVTCQVCLERTAERAPEHDEMPDGSGARPHLYDPNPRAYRLS